MKNYSNHPLTLEVELELLGGTISVRVDDELTRGFSVPSTNEAPEIGAPKETSFGRGLSWH